MAQGSTDSLRYYQKKLGRMHRTQQTQFLQSDSVKIVLNRINELRSEAENYSSFMMFANMASVDLNKFNEDNMAAGFGAMKGNIWNFGMGFSGKKNHSIFDLTFFGFGKVRKINNGNATIRLGFSTILQFDYGYDLVKSSKINIYPYLGVGFRTSRLRYDSTVAINPGATGISNLIINNRNVDTYTEPLRYRAGLGIEFVLKENKVGGGSIFFAKLGTSRPFKDRGYKVENIYYDPAFKTGALDITFGFKFFGRN